MQIHDLGRLEIESTPGRAPVAVVGAKQIALLSALCVLRDTRVSFEVLREAAWGEDAVVSDATIENHVWRLRKAIEPGVPAARSCVRHEEGGYRLDLPPESVDSSSFEALAESAREAALRADYRAVLERCERATTLWRGEPFVSVAHVSRIGTAIDRLAEIRAQLEERRVDALLALGDTEQAALESVRLTTLHPFQERLWAQRMTAFVRLGRVEEALSAYQQVRSTLLDELGLDPGRELQDLQRAIIAQEEPDPAPSASTPSASPPWPEPTWPLVGRAGESAAATAAVGAGHVILVEAAAGIGRTRMLDEIARIARTAGTEVLRFVGTRSAATVPLGVFADLVPSVARSGDRLTQLQRCAAAMRESASQRRLLLCVDDAHLVDEPSAALILQLASGGDVSVALTVRAGEPLPDAIGTLSRLDNTRPVMLEPLDEPESAQLFELALGGPTDELLHRWAYRTTRGNAFHIVELARAVRRDAAVRQIAGRWISDGIPSVPTSLAALVQGALERLDGPARDVVDRLALAEPMRWEGLGDDAALLVDLERRGLVAVEDRGHEQRVVLAHPLFSAVLRETLPPLRARQVRLELIARFGARTGLAADERLRLAQWRMDVGEAGLLADRVVAAGLALASNDPELALRLLEQPAHDAGEAAAADVDVRLLRAQAHVLRRELPEAAIALQDLEPALRTAEQGAVYLEMQLEVERFGHSLVDDVPALFARAARWWPDDEDWTRFVERVRLRDEVFENQAAAAGIGDAPDSSEATRLGALYYEGRTDEARALFARIAQDPPLLTLDQVASAAIGARVELDRGDGLVAFEARMARMRTIAYDVDDPAAIGIATSKLADLRLLQGALDQARELYFEAARQWERRDPIALRASAWAGIAIAAAQQGDLRESERALDRLREIAGEKPRAHLVPYLARAEAAYAVSRGHQEFASSRLDDAVARLSGSPVHVARLHYERVLLGLPIHESVVQTVRTAADASDSPLLRLYAAHIDAVFRGDADALRGVAQRLRDLGIDAYAGCAQADASRFA